VFKIYGEDLDFVFTELRKKGCRRVDRRRASGGYLRAGRARRNRRPAHGRGGRSLRREPQHEKAIKAGIAAALLVGDGLCRCTWSPRSKAESREVLPRLCSSTTHHFVYGDIGRSIFVFNNPESACRTCGGLGVDKLTHPELLIPDQKRSIRGGCFVKEAFKYNPDTWDGRVMFSLSKSLDFSLDTPWKDLKESQRQAVLYGSTRRRWC
jgi:excinuclease ABC subunit A